MPQSKFRVGEKVRFVGSEYTSSEAKSELYGQIFTIKSIYTRLNGNVFLRCLMPDGKSYSAHLRSVQKIEHQQLLFPCMPNEL